MKRPKSPPNYTALFEKHISDLSKIFPYGTQTQGGEYLHWDKIRHMDPPGDLNVEQWWFAIKVARSTNAKMLSFADINGLNFSYVLTPEILQALHEIDSKGAGRIAMPEPVTTPGTRERFLFRSLAEEAITSSQLEGASTTRKAALDMFRSGRQPQTKDERMIFNNLKAMSFIREYQKEKLTPELILEIHRRLTEGTLPASSVGRMQTPGDERIHVGSNSTGEVLHMPPPAASLPDRLKQMCMFANAEGEEYFLHPIIRAIILHLWLGYDHPFEDGNGRTARALFYWAMLNRGYWLFEFISISTILRSASAQYGRSFLYTETDGNDATYFISYQLRVILRALHLAEHYLERKTKLIEETESLLRNRGEFNYRQLALLTYALRNNHAEFTVKSHQVSHSVAYATARSDLMNLVERGLLEDYKQPGSRKATYIPSKELHKMVN
jgi:Fic family protein